MSVPAVGAPDGECNWEIDEVGPELRDDIQQILVPVIADLRASINVGDWAETDAALDRRELVFSGTIPRGRG